MTSDRDQVSERSSERTQARAELAEVLDQAFATKPLAYGLPFALADAVLAHPVLVLRALGMTPGTMFATKREAGNWTETDQPAWCDNCEEYGWGRPVWVEPPTEENDQ